MAMAPDKLLKRRGLILRNTDSTPQRVAFPRIHSSKTSEGKKVNRVWDKTTRDPGSFFGYQSAELNTGANAADLTSSAKVIAALRARSNDTTPSSARRKIAPLPARARNILPSRTVMDEAGAGRDIVNERALEPPQPRQLKHIDERIELAGLVGKSKLRFSVTADVEDEEMAPIPRRVERDVVTIMRSMSLNDGQWYRKEDGVVEQEDGMEVDDGGFDGDGEDSDGEAGALPMQ